LVKVAIVQARLERHFSIFCRSSFPIKSSTLLVIALTDIYKLANGAKTPNTQ